MPKSFSSIACMILICTLYSLAADRSATNFSSLPPEAQVSVETALRSDPTIESFTLTALNGQDSSEFGISVAADGNTVVVGAPLAGSTGAAYVFVKPANGWGNMTQTAELTASDSNNGDLFGVNVGISGDTIVVGAPGATVGINQAQGAAYVFVEPAGGWTNMTQTAKLTASDGVYDSQLGRGASISANTVVVGAPFGGAGALPGSAYVFLEPPGGWTDMTQTAELTVSNAPAGYEFGISTAVSGATVLVGADINESGAAYVFVEPPNGWSNMTQTAELTASDGGGAFGYSVSLSGDTAVVGAPLHDNNPGAVYIFVEPNGGWVNTTQTAELTAGSIEYLGLGASVSISGNAILAGAPGWNGYTGLAFVFTKPARGWQTTSKYALKLSMPFQYRSEHFGGSVTLSGQTGIVGAFDAPTTCRGNRCVAGPGQAFIFTTQ